MLKRRTPVNKWEKKLPIGYAIVIEVDENIVDPGILEKNSD